MTDRLAALKREENKNKVMTAYENYLADPSRFESDLWPTLLDFFQMKLYRLEVEQYRTLGTPQTVDDWTQDATIKVWEHLPRFVADTDNTPEKFFFWINTIAFHKRADAANYLKKENEGRVKLILTHTDEKGNAYSEINPDVLNKGIFLPEHRESTIEGRVAEFAFRLPANLQGVDRKILKQLATPVIKIDGNERSRTYEEAADDLGLTLSAVKQRMSALKRRIRQDVQDKDRETKTRRNAKWEAREAERRGATRRNLDAFRAQQAAVLDQIAKESSSAEQPEEECCV